MYYSEKVLLSLGFALSMGNVCGMERENWGIEKIVEQLKTIHASLDPKAGFTKQLNRLAFIDEGIIAQGVLLSNNVYTSIDLLLKDNSLQNKPLMIIDCLNGLRRQINTFIDSINVSLQNMDELIANAQVNHNLVITKEELRITLKLLLLRAVEILSDIKIAINLTQSSLDIQRYGLIF